MYPTANPPLSTKLQSDIEYLTKTVDDANHKPYLKAPLIDSLVSLGHNRTDAEAGVDQYFKASLQ